MQVEQDAVVLGRGRALRRRPLPSDVRAQRVQALDEPEVAVALELQAGGEGKVAAAALPRDDDPGRVDAQLLRARGDPLQPGHAVVEPGRERRHLRY